MAGWGERPGHIGLAPGVETSLGVGLGLCLKLQWRPRTFLCGQWHATAHRAHPQRSVSVGVLSAVGREGSSPHTALAQAAKAGQDKRTEGQFRDSSPAGTTITLLLTKASQQGSTSHLGEPPKDTGLGTV